MYRNKTDFAEFPPNKGNGTAQAFLGSTAEKFIANDREINSGQMEVGCDFDRGDGHETDAGVFEAFDE